MDLKKQVQAHREMVVKIRQDLHQIPELGFKEEKTAAYVAGFLNKKGFNVKTHVAKHGVVSLLESGRPGPTLLIRADMDALPIQEATGLSFASTHPGAMHACGHDGHMAMALGAAVVMQKLKDRFTGNIKFVFQPAEEGPGGAKPMIEAGVMEDPHVDYALGCHVWPTLPQGTIGVRSGPLLAAMFRFELTIKGRGGHGGMPDLCIDPVDIGCQVVNALQRLVSRKMDPLNPAVVTVGSFHAGTTFNVIPETATLCGTARTFDKQVWNAWPERIEKVVKGVCQSMGADYEIAFLKGYPPTVNDDEMAKTIEKCAARVVGKDKVLVPEKTMGGEDMAYFLEKAKGCFFCIGAGNPKYAGIHSPKFDFNEDILLNGVETFCRAGLELLGK